MHAVVAQEEALLPGSPEGCAVRVALAEVGVPRVEVGVEVHEGQRTVPGRRGPQQGQGDRVIAPDGDDVRTLGQEALAPASICVTASSVLNGVQAMSPASTT